MSQHMGNAIWHFPFLLYNINMTGKTIINIKNSYYQAEFFLTYPIHNHTLAHLYEHLITGQACSGNYTFTQANTGSGIINIKIQNSRNAINQKELENLLTLANIKQTDFNLEKERLIGELTELVNERSRFFYQAVQYQTFNYQLLQQVIKKISHIKFDSVKKFVNFILPKQLILILAGPTLKTVNWSRQKQIKKIIYLACNNKPSLRPPKLIDSVKRSLNSLINHNQINIRVKIKNILEAHLLQLVGGLAYPLLKNLLHQQGVYQLKGDLFKDYDQHLYLNYSFSSHQQKSKRLLNLIIKSLQSLEPDRIDLVREKKEIIKNLREANNSNLTQLQDYIWQILEWGNYLTPGEEVKIFNGLTAKKLKLWWTKKLRESTFHKVILKY